MQARLFESQDCFSLEQKPITWWDSLTDEDGSEEEEGEAAPSAGEGAAGAFSPSAAVTWTRR